MTPDPIQIGKALADIRGAMADVDKYVTATKRAIDGKDPFPPPKDVARALNRLVTLENQLDVLARRGIGRPEEALIHADEWADPDRRPGAMAKMWNNMVGLETAVKEGKTLVSQLSQVEQQAAARASVCDDLVRIFAIAVQTPTGPSTAPQAKAFELVRIFEKAGGQLSSVGSAARDARNTVTPTVNDMAVDLQNLNTTVATFTKTYSDPDADPNSGIDHDPQQSVMYDSDYFTVHTEPSAEPQSSAGDEDLQQSVMRDDDYFTEHTEPLVDPQSRFDHDDVQQSAMQDDDYFTPDTQPDVKPQSPASEPAPQQSTMQNDDYFSPDTQPDVKPQSPASEPAPQQSTMPDQDLFTPDTTPDMGQQSHLPPDLPGSEPMDNDAGFDMPPPGDHR